jgi:Serine dehydrogenase proteinase
VDADYPVSAAEAKQLGLPVTTDMPDYVLEMMSLYPQPVRQSRGGVEYRPVPRQKEVGRPLPAKGDADCYMLEVGHCHIRQV